MRVRVATSLFVCMLVACGYPAPIPGHDAEGEQISAWAFARWGGAFYLFLTVSSFGAPNGSEV